MDLEWLAVIGWNIGGVAINYAILQTNYGTKWNKWACWVCGVMVILLIIVRLG